MSINAQKNTIFNSNRWISFLESTAKGLQVNLSFFLSDVDRIEASSFCPICQRRYNALTNSDMQRAFILVQHDFSNFVTEEGDAAVALALDGDIPCVVRDCPACNKTGSLILSHRAQIAQKLLNSFFTALAEGIQGGCRAIEISTLRHMNHIILSLFQGEDDAADRSFDLILSALIIILDAQGSWLELDNTSWPQFLYKGDHQAITNYLSSGPDSSGLTVEVSTSGIKGRAGILAPADIQQAKELLPLMAQEIAIVIEIDSLFKLFHKQLIRILEAIDSGIVLVDKNGTLSYVNHPFEQLFGISSLDIIGKSAAGIAGPWTPYLKSSNDQRVEGKIEVLNLNNKQVYVDWQVSPLIDEETVQGWVIFIKDRTDYYHWQSAVKKAERLAVTAGLVGSLAHELRNPLSAAKALLQLTRQKGDTHHSGGYIDLVERELDRVTRLLNEFLLLGKPAEKQKEPVQLASLLRELKPLLESETSNYSSDLIMDLCSESCVQADSGQLTQVVMNLIRNAAQAAGERGKITVSLHEKAQNIFLSIQDTGPGIGPDLKDKLFRPFFTTKERGTGLGLPIVQAIVHNHGGDIWAENAKEGGAVFRVALPSCVNGGTAQPDVLMVVKDLMIKYPTEKALKEAGLSIVAIDSLQQAIILLEGCRPQIIVIENCLLAETENLRLLRQNAGNAKIAIIGEPYYSTGCDNIINISRPLNYTRLVSQLRLLLQQ